MFACFIIFSDHQSYAKNPSFSDTHLETKVCFLCKMHKSEEFLSLKTSLRVGSVVATDIFDVGFLCVCVQWLGSSFYRQDIFDVGFVCVCVCAMTGRQFLSSGYLWRGICVCVRVCNDWAAVSMVRMTFKVNVSTSSGKMHVCHEFLYLRTSLRAGLIVARVSSGMGSFYAVLWNHNYSPRSGELRTQKLKSYLVRTQSLNVLPLKSGVGQNIAIHATLTARNFFLAYFYPSGPFTCIFSKPLPIFPVLAVANTWFLCRPAE